MSLLSDHDYDALYAGFRELGWRENLARARVSIIRSHVKDAERRLAVDFEPGLNDDPKGSDDRRQDA